MKGRAIRIMAIAVTLGLAIGLAAAQARASTGRASPAPGSPAPIPGLTPLMAKRMMAQIPLDEAATRIQHAAGRRSGRRAPLAEERRGDEAAEWYRRAATVFAAKADRFGWGRAQLGLGELALAEGNATDAAGLFRDSLEQFTAYGVTLWEDRALRRLQSALAGVGEEQPARLAT